MRAASGLVIVVLLAGCPPGGETTGGTVTMSSGSSSGDTSIGPGSTVTQGDTGSTTDPTTTTDAGSTTTHAIGDTGTTVGPAETGPDTSTTGDSTTGDSTTGDSTTGGSTTSDSTTSDSTTGDSTTGDSTTGDSGDETDTAGDPLCCEKGCSTALLRSHTEAVEVRHGGARIAGRDADGNLSLWDADTLAPVLRVAGVARAELVGNTLVYRAGAELHVVDATDGDELGTFPAGVSFGVAQDESYVWTAGPQGLAVRELDGALRWSAAGDLGDARVLAAFDAVHVFDADLAAQAVVRFDAADGSPANLPFLGTFAGWFADVPRWWTTQGNSYRVYDPDGTQVALADGAPKYGWGTRLASQQAVWDIFDPAATLPFAGQPMFSGPAVMTVKWDGQTLAVALIRLDEQPLAASPVAPVCCVQQGQAWSFAFAGGAWVVGGYEGGLAADHLGRFVSPGEVVGLAGSSSGRVAIGVASDEVRVLDVAGDCTIAAHPPFAREGEGLWLSADGTHLLSSERWKEGNQASGYVGTRFYAMPQGALLAGAQLQGIAYLVRDHDVADDGGAWSRLYQQVPLYHHSAGPFPLGPAFTGGIGSVLPKLAPGGGHVATSDGDANKAPALTGRFTYVRDPVNLVAVFEGIPQGFLDDEHILVGRYQGQNSAYAGAEIVGLDGVVVQPTPLPDLRKIYRVGTGEILGVAHPSGQAAIFDPWTGAELWTAPPGTTVALAGPDHVVVSDLANVDLIRWR